jgi:hypothetical protein
MAQYPVIVNQSYDFVFQAPAILSIGIQNAKVLSEASYSIASLINPDLVALHEQVKPYLTGGANDDATTLNYLILQTVEGEKRVYAMDWLASAPVVANYHDVNFYIKSVSPDNIQYIRDLLVNAGFTQFSYTQV